MVAAALITLFGFLFSARPNLRTQLVGALCAVGALIVVAGWRGERGGRRARVLAVAEREDHFSAAHRECSMSEVTEGTSTPEHGREAVEHLGHAFTLADSQLTARRSVASRPR
ncbi:MAG: hypothetical protein R2705_23280 [Ilumatobacteraceae bacterium]